MKNAISLKRNCFDIVPYLFIAPALLVLASFIILPVIMAVRYSFYNFNMLRPDRISLIGVENYKNIITDDLFLPAINDYLINTLFKSGIPTRYRRPLPNRLHRLRSAPWHASASSWSDHIPHRQFARYGQSRARQIHLHYR